MMMKTKLYYSPCPDYEENDIRQALDELLVQSGLLDWVTPGMKIAVKVNLVAAMKADTAAVTHPVAVAGLCRLLTERGATVIVGDSPGGTFTGSALATAYRVSGMTAVEAAGAKLNTDTSQREIEVPDGEKTHRFTVTAWLEEADAFINFAKLKTHGLMAYSGNVKNLFGTIPGTVKVEYHNRYPTAERFADMLILLNEYWKCRLNLLDAVFGMEGNGPTAGTPRRIGLLLASPSPYALDLAALSLIGLPPAEVPTVAAAIARGVGPASLDACEEADGLAAYAIKDYALIRRDSLFRLGSILKGPLGKAAGYLSVKCLTARPNPEKSACIGCGKCASVCPAHAIRMENKFPRITRRDCIRCFCCQEFCPVGAMQVRRPTVARLLNHKRPK